MDASDMHKPAGYGRKLAPLGFWLGRHSSTVIHEGSDAGHASTRTTEIVYRRELRPVITTGAEIMDELFGAASPSRQPENR